jgi:PAS domain S-box-containing protein
MDITGPTILLVDDTEAQRYALSRCLQAAGFQVQEAADGVQALDLAQLQPDLILLDVVLPDMDGFEVCRRLKANPDLAHIPVIYMSTSLVESEHRVEGLELGADDYIVRPIATKELVAKLRAWLRVRRAETELRARNAELETALNALRANEQESRTMFAILAHAGQMARLGAWDVAISEHGGLMDSALHWSDEVFRIFGYEPGEVVPSSRLFLKRVHPYDRQLVLATLMEAMARNRPYELEHRILRADGLERIVLQRAEISFDSRGRPRHIIGAVQDITESKRAELALREREQQLAAVLAALPVAVYIADAAGDLLQANPAADKLWGAAAPLVAASEYHRYLGWFADTGVPLQSDDWALLRAIRTGEVVADQEVDIETFDGTHKTILASALPIRGAGGRITGGVAINVDITHRKRMERDLHEAKELVETRLAQFHATINSMTEGVCFFDAQGEALLVNDAFFRTYGFDPECLPENTRKMRSLLAAYDLDGNFIPLGEWPVFTALRGKVVTHRELRVRRLDTGREVILRHNAAPVRDAAGKPMMAVVTIEDVTAMKQAEAALVRSEKLASVGRMAATVAHEINNPLAAVMNTLFLARSAVDAPESVQRYLDLADTELKRIAHITRQALGFYRESSKPEMTSIAPVLDSAIDLLKSKVKAKHVKIERDYETTPPVLAIAGELRQVFSNLLANSLDAVDENAAVKLRISSARFGRNAERCVRITVADNGTGIVAAALPHVFEPFFTTKESVGTGLGLWVSKQIVEKHGGSLRVHSCTSAGRRGTAFAVFLPIGAAEVTVQTAASA